MFSRLIGKRTAAAATDATTTTTTTAAATDARRDSFQNNSILSRGKEQKEQPHADLVPVRFFLKLLLEFHTRTVFMSRRRFRQKVNF